MINGSNGHFAEFAATGREMVGFGLSYRNLEKLKREIDVAVWNWETRRGLPHYDGGMRAMINEQYMVSRGRKVRSTSHFNIRQNGAVCGTVEKLA